MICSIGLSIHSRKSAQSNMSTTNTLYVRFTPDGGDLLIERWMELNVRCNKRVLPMSSSVSMNEVWVEPPDTQPYAQADFNVDGLGIAVNKYTDRYECFWSTDEEIGLFEFAVDQQFGLGDEIPVSAYHRDESELVDVDTYGDLKEKYSVHYLEELELDFGSFRVTWGEEGPAVNENRDFEPYSIIIFSQDLDPEPVKKLYRATDGLNQDDDIVDSLVKEADDYLSN